MIFKFTFKNWELHGDHQCAHVVETGEAATKSSSPASGELVKIVKASFLGEYWFDPELGMVVGVDDDEDVIYTDTTRTQTLTREERAKTHFTLLDVE